MIFGTFLIKIVNIFLRLSNSYCINIVIYSTMRLEGGITMYTINMLSKADSIKGQGVGSAYLEQVALVKEELSSWYTVTVNSKKPGNITHYHSINFRYFLSIPFAKLKGTAVGYVHFLPETLENSIRLPFIIKNIFYWYVIRYYKSMDLLVTVNPCFIEKLAAYGIDKEKVTYIPNYVSEKEFHPISYMTKEQLKEKYGLSKDKFVVLTVGQLQLRKGIMEFLEIAKKMPEYQFVWAGDFSFGRITDGYDIIKEVRKSPPANVIFLGLVEREHMNEIYNLADVMFLPSFSELFPMTILESMNSSIPILLRDLDIYDDILFDFYLKGNSNEEFISIIQQLKSDPDFNQKAIAMSDKGRMFYCKEHVAKMWNTFYREALFYRKSEVKVSDCKKLLLAKRKTGD